MTNATSPRSFDVIVVGGSYAGLAAGMALGRALRTVLIIDGGEPCNAQTPRSHNFVTHDGETPRAIAAAAKAQVAAYRTVEFFEGIATGARATEGGFLVRTEQGAAFAARKLIFASGIRDRLPAIAGFAECWGISALHCPYCHGYEVRDRATAVLGNGDRGFDFAALISNWTSRLVLLTNGEPTLTAEQSAKLCARGIDVIGTEIASLRHLSGQLEQIEFKDGTSMPLDVLYTRPTFEQHCRIPEALGCELTPDGYLAVDATQRTSVAGVYACGDNASSMRTVANAVGSGTAAGMMANRALVLEAF